MSITYSFLERLYAIVFTLKTGVHNSFFGGAIYFLDQLTVFQPVSEISLIICVSATRQMQAFTRRREGTIRKLLLSGYRLELLFCSSLPLSPVSYCPKEKRTPLKKVRYGNNYSQGFAMFRNLI